MQREPGQEEKFVHFPVDGINYHPVMRGGECTFVLQYWLEVDNNAEIFLLIVLMAIITGVLWNPVGGLTRYIGGLWLLTALLLDTMYRSNLKAMLTIQRANIPFNNVEELADSNIPIAIYKDSTADLQIMVRFGLSCCNKSSRYSLY